jgi:hypothetical protein
MRGPTILSAGQLELYSNKVNDRALRIDNDGQQIITNDGFEFPLHVRQGLPYLDMRPYTDHESWDTYPHVIMTSNASTYNNGTNFDAYGTYCKVTIVVASARTVMDDPILQGTALTNEMLVTHEYPPDVEPDIIPKTVDAANGTYLPETTNVQIPDLPSDPAPVVVFTNISLMLHRLSLIRLPFDHSSHSYPPKLSSVPYRQLRNTPVCPCQNPPGGSSSRRSGAQRCPTE